MNIRINPIMQRAAGKINGSITIVDPVPPPNSVLKTANALMMSPTAVSNNVTIIFNPPKTNKTLPIIFPTISIIFIFMHLG